MVKATATASGCFHVNVEEKWSSIVTKLLIIFCLISHLQYLLKEKRNATIT